MLRLVLLLFFLAPLATSHAQTTRHAVLIGGLGGDPSYTERFGGYLNEARTLLIDRHGIPQQNVTVLAENRLTDRPFVDDVSTAENIRAAFSQLATKAAPDDHVYVVLFGHGSFDGTRAQLNIPRRDLDDVDYAALLDGLDAARIVFVNTASASGPFASVLSGPNRIIIAATASGTQRDETVFPGFFVEAMRTPDADLDKSGGVSILEAARYAAEEAARSFEAAGHLATEHAVIDDDGDGEPTRFDRLRDAASDGALAALTYISAQELLAEINEADRPLVGEREEIRRAIAELKSRKASMNEDAYYAELETLLIRLARITERLEPAQ